MTKKHTMTKLHYGCYTYRGHDINCIIRKPCGQAMLWEIDRPHTICQRLKDARSTINGWKKD